MLCIHVMLPGLPGKHIRNDPGNGKIKLVLIIYRLGDLDKIKVTTFQLRVLM